jgi:hypothetical protein
VSGEKVLMKMVVLMETATLRNQERVKSGKMSDLFEFLLNMDISVRPGEKPYMFE